ncbi:glycoside hydrolase family 9 protein, partial [Enterobacter hormaechei]|uniref:glycoside hydrolase family 9 protein n=1 Tax=Enterobacter hormaechei TaxID=158836 RepID=UPI0022F0D4C0
QYALSGKRQVWNWDSRSPAAFVLFAEIANARPGIAQAAGLSTNLTGWQKETEAYLDSIVNGKQGYLTKGGLLYYPGDSDEASLNPAVAAATLMLRYAPLASSSDKTASYNSFAKGQI